MEAETDRCKRGQREQSFSIEVRTVFCSRIPTEMAIPKAMMEALMEYSNQRQYAKQSSSCLTC